VTIDAVERRVFAEDLAVEAGNVALSYHGREDLDIRSKGVLDWVTEADLATERLIWRRIGESLPDDRVVGEETGGNAETPPLTRVPLVVPTRFELAFPA